jgi:hypothetical protein
VASPARFREDSNAEEDLVLGGYRDRLVVELAQNAADAAARAGIAGQLRFELDADVLRVANTGAALDAAGVESASTLRASSKRDDVVASIGRFGVGFAAVLAVSDEPTILTRHAAVGWSRKRTLAEIAKVPALGAELARRGEAVPMLRLPYGDLSAAPPPEPYDTQVVLPLRDAAAVALTRELLAGVDVALLLTMPALSVVEIVVDGELRRLVAAPAPDGVVVDGVRWRLQASSGRLDPAVLRERPVEEQARRQFTLTWAVPVATDGTPMPLPSTLPAVAHAPSPTDEPLSLPALLIAPLPLDPTRRHVAAGALRDHLVSRAAAAFVELLRELPCVPEILTMVPVGMAAGLLDSELRAAVVDVLRGSPFLASSDDGVRVSPSQALVLDCGGPVVDDDLLALLGEVLPALVPGAWVRKGQPALEALGVRHIALVDVIDELVALDKPPAWWHALYAALARAGIDPQLLAGLPVPLSSGELARSPRGLAMPGRYGDLSVLGLRTIDPEAAHPLLPRAGAVEAEPAAMLTGERVRAAVENSYESSDPAAIADAVLRLVAASGVSVVDEPWLAELALPADDGELFTAGELLIPSGKLAGLVADDSPFGVVDPALLDHWGAGVLTAVGVLDGFAVVRAFDVTDADHDLDGEQEYLELLGSLLDATEPVVVDELVAIRDLEFVRDDAWPLALALLAQPPYRAVVMEQAVASTSTKQLRVLSYTAWWLRRHRIVQGRASTSDPWLEGLYDVVSSDLDGDFLSSAGMIHEIRDVDPDDLAARIADPGRQVTRNQVRALYARLQPAEPPLAVRAVRGGELVVVSAEDAVVVDHPDLLPLLGTLAVLPVALGAAVAVADALDLTLASELGPFPVVSTGSAFDDYVVHSPLLVEDIDNEPKRVAWRLVDGVLHVDAASLAFGVGRGRAWRIGDWSRRHVETELLRDDASAELILAEADLDAIS